MAKIIPFRAVRPAKDKAHLVASRSVDGYNSAQLKSKLTENPYTFLHIIQPDLRKPPKTKPHSPERLQKVKNTFKEFVEKGILNADLDQAYYIYKQDQEAFSFTGIFACASIDDYFSGVIKKHEETRSAREEKLMQYLEVCDFNAEPVCLCYPDNARINNAIDAELKKEAVYDFTTTDRIRHRLWKISNADIIKIIGGEFEKMNAIYIADGHHRTSSSALLGKKLREKNPNHTGKEPYNFFLCALFPESELKIFEFNRLVKTAAGFKIDELLKKLSADFKINKIEKRTWKPERKGVFSIYHKGTWYKLELKNSNTALDADVLSEKVLGPQFGIKDLKTDKRISFVSGLKGPEAMQKMVDSGKADIGFGLYPVSVKDVIQIADAGKIMPPKTTWVEPKLRSGLVVYKLND